MSKDDATWLNICYVAFALVMAYVGFQAIFTIGQQLGWSDRFDEWFSAANNIGGLLIGALSAVWLRSEVARREFHLASIGEVRKVTWPTIPDTKKMTLIVAVVVAIFAVILAIFDIVWSKILQVILP